MRFHPLIPIILLLAAATASAQQYEHARWIRGGHMSIVEGVAFTPDSRWIVSAASDGSVKVWNVESGELDRVLIPSGVTIEAMTISPDGSRIALARAGGDIRLIDIASGATTRQMKRYDASVISLAFSPDGKRLVGGSHAHAAVWDIESGDTVMTMRGHTNTVEAVDWSPDGSMIATASTDFTVKLWRVSDGALLRTFQWAQGAVFCVTFSPDSKRVASMAGRAHGAVFDIATGERLVAFGPANTVAAYDGVAIRYSLDGSKIILGARVSNENGEMAYYDSETGGSAPVGRWTRPNTVTAVAVSPDGRYAVGGELKGALFITAIAAPHAPDSLKMITQHTAEVTAVAFSPDESIVISGDRTGSIRLWDEATGRRLPIVAAETFAIRSLAFTPDGTGFISGSDNGTVTMWRLDSTDPVKTFYASAEWAVTSAALAPDRRTLVGGIGTGDSTILLWDTSSIKPVKTFVGHHDAVTAIVFSGEGRYLVSGSDDHTIRIWDVETGEEITSMSDHTAGITSLAASPDGRSVASASEDHTIRIWDVPSGDLLRTLPGHDRSVTSVAYSSDGATLVSAGLDSTVRVWNSSTGRELYRYRDFPAGMLSVAIGGTKRRVAAGTNDASLIVWDLVTTSSVDMTVGESRGTAVAAPNPVSGSTTIYFELPAPQRTTVSIVDARGAIVERIVDEELSGGAHAVTWNGSNASSGVYFCRITAHGSVTTIPIVVTR